MKQELLIHLTEEGETTTLELLRYEDGKLKERLGCNYYCVKETLYGFLKRNLKSKKQTQN